MELRQLRNFIAVVDRGSFGTAAHTLGLSQPTITKSIRSLEASVGAPLFERAVKGSTPTAFGRALEPHARAILNQADRAKSEIADHLGARRGHLSVMFGGLATDVLFPTMLQRFHESHPKVEVALETGYCDAILAALRAGTAELAICFLAPQTVDTDIAAEILMADQRVFVAAGASHPLAGRRHVTAREAWQHPWALPGQIDVFRAKLAELFARLDLPPPAASSEIDSIAVQRRVLRGGFYLGSIAELAVREDIAAGHVREIHVPELAWTYNAGALYRKSVPLSPAARRFLDIARVVSREAAEKTRRVRTAR